MQSTGLEGILKSPRLADVFRTWEGVSRRMIVYEYDTGGLSFDSSPDYHPVVDYCRIFATAAETVLSQKDVCLIGVDCPAFFVSDIFQQGIHLPENYFWR